MNVHNFESRTTPNSMHRSTREKMRLYFVNNQRGTDYQIRSLEFPTTPLLYLYTPAGFNEWFSPAALRGTIVGGNLYHRQHKTMKMCTHKYRCMNRIKHAYPRHGRIYILLHDVRYDTVGDRLHHPHEHK
jgi:hypothetical protein